MLFDSIGCSTCIVFSRKKLISSMDLKRAKALAKKARYDHLLSEFPIKLAKSPSKGRHVLAAQDLEAGTIVISEMPVGYALFKDSMDELCLACLNPLPDQLLDGSKEPTIRMMGASNRSKGFCCAGCRKQTFYCSKECQSLDSDRHALECETVKHLSGIAGAHSVDYGLLRLIVRFLANRITARAKEDTQYLPHVDAYTCTLDLVGHQSSMGDKWLDSLRNAGTRWLETNKGIAQDLMTDSEGKLETSVEEIIQLACQINANSFVLYEPLATSQHEIGVSLLPMSALLNHSCAPNCVSLTDARGKSIVRTVEDVKKGQELCISYVDLYLPTSERRGKLLETKFFWCQCTRCVENLHQDMVIEGIRCEACSAGYLYQDESEVYKCESCASSISCETYHDIQLKAEGEYESAFDFIKIGDFACARSAIESFRNRHQGILHPLHTLFFNSFPPLINCCIKMQDYVSAIGYSREMISNMDKAFFIPQHWPEKSDYYYRLGELEEILAMAVKNKLLETDTINHVQEAKNAYQKCFEMRSLVYGSTHPSSTDAYDQLTRLEEAFI